MTTDDTQTADAQRDRDESDLIIRETMRAYGTWDALDRSRPLTDLAGAQAADAALVIVANRLADVLQAMSDPSRRVHRCGYCWRAAGATDTAWSALPSMSPDEAHAHAQACEHNPLVVEVGRLRDLMERAAATLEAKSDRAARVEWAAVLRREARP